MTYIPSPIAHVIVAAAVVLWSAAGAAAQEHPIHGTWVVQVRLLTACTAGTPLPPFWSLLTFAAGGTVTGSTLNQAFAPGQRGPDQGVWAPAPGGAVASTVALLPFATAPSPPQSPGFQAGGQRIDQTIVMAGSDSFTSTARVTFVDLAGVAYRHGCAVATAWRFR